MSCCNDKINKELSGIKQEIYFSKQPIAKNNTDTGIASTNTHIISYTFAVVKEKKGSQFYGDKTIIGEQITHTFTIEYEKEISDKINSGFYINCNGKTFKIKNVSNLDEANIALRYDCIFQTTNQPIVR